MTVGHETSLKFMYGIMVCYCLYCEYMWRAVKKMIIITKWTKNTCSSEIGHNIWQWYCYTYSIENGFIYLTCQCDQKSSNATSLCS